MQKITACGTKKLFLLYLCLFFVSGFYRFYNLDKRSFFPGSDAPVYAGIVRTYRAGIDYVIRSKILRQDIGSANDFFYENGGEINAAAKDGVIPIGLAGSILFGNNENTILYTSALFGVLSTLLIFYILTRSIGIFYSFIISLLFAVSPYHIGFSREGLTVVFSSFFLLFAICLYTRFLESKRLDYLFCCGLSLGAGFLCHYNIAPFIFVFFAYELYSFYVMRNGIKRIMVICVSVFTPLFLMDIFTRTLKFYGATLHINLIEAYSTYFASLSRQLIDVKRGGTDIHEGPLYYFKNLIYLEGVIPALFLVFAVFLIIRRGVKNDSGVGYFLFTLFLLPFIYFFKLQHTITDRAMLSFIPLWYLILGWGICQLERRRKIFVPLILAAVLINGFRSLDYFNYKSNFQDAIEYMRRNKGVKHVTSVWSLSRLYAGRKNVVNHADPPYSQKLTSSRNVIYQVNNIAPEEFKALYKKGYNYLLLNIPPSVTNALTDAAMNMRPDYSTDMMVCNDRGDGYDAALLRDGKSRFSYRFNVYDLGKILNTIQRNDADG